MDTKSTSRNSLWLNLTILSIFGWWPPDSVRNNNKIYLYLVYSIVSVGFFFILYMTTEVINFIVVWGDIEKMVESSFLLLTHMAQLVKMVVMLTWTSKIKILIDQFEDPMFNQSKPEHVKILNRCACIVKRETRVFLSMAVATVFLWAIFPALESKNGWELPLRAWYPFDTTRTPVFQLIYIYQIVAVMIDAGTNISTDTLASGIMVLTAGQLDILNYNLANLDTRSSDVKADGDRYEKLIYCIKHHQAIIKFVYDQNDAFKSAYMGQFIVAVIVICITAFQLTLVPISIQFFSMILYLGCMLMEIFLYCYHGNEIILKSGEVLTAANNCEWYKHDPQFAKTLMFVMERTKKPLQVTAGKLFSLSLATFAAILRSSYSYFAVLQHINSEQQGDI